MSRMARSGARSRTSSTASSPRPGLAHDLVALLLEGLLEVEADDGLVFGDDDAGGHGGILSRFGGGSGLGSRPGGGRAARPGSARAWRCSSSTSARCRCMASAWRWASWCSRSASGVSDTSARSRASSASRRGGRAARRTRPARSRSCLRRVATSEGGARRGTGTSAAGDSLGSRPGAAPPDRRHARPSWPLAPAAVAGCGGGSGADGACGPITREALDPAFLVHVLGDDERRVHLRPADLGPPPAVPAGGPGVVDEPLSRARPGRASSSAATCCSSTGPTSPPTSWPSSRPWPATGVVVAPNPDLAEPGGGHGLAVQAHLRRGRRRRAAGVRRRAARQGPRRRGPAAVATDAWGIDDGWSDTDGRWQRRRAGPRTTPLRAAMGGDPTATARRRGRGRRGPRRRATPLLGPAPPRPRGRHRRRRRRPSCPPDLPLGPPRRSVRDDGGARPRSLRRPRPLPPARRACAPGALAVQVPTARSRGSWGIGDLADVRGARRLGGRRGRRRARAQPAARAHPRRPDPGQPVLPVEPALAQPAAAPGRRGARRRRRPGGRAAAAAAARRLLAEPVVDRDRVLGAPARGARAPLGDRAGRDADRGSAAWRAEQGAALEGWARYCALAEVARPGWPRWPAELRHPDAAGGGAARARRAGRPRRLPRLAAAPRRRPAGRRRRARRACASSRTSPSAPTPTAPTPGCCQDLLALGRQHRRAARRVRSPTARLGAAAVRAVAAARRAATARSPSCSARRWPAAAACASTT